MPYCQSLKQWWLERFSPASEFVKADREIARNPPLPISSTVMCKPMTADRLKSV